MEVEYAESGTKDPEEELVGGSQCLTRTCSRAQAKSCKEQKKGNNGLSMLGSLLLLFLSGKQGYKDSREWPCREGTREKCSPNLSQ